MLGGKSNFSITNDFSKLGMEDQAILRGLYIFGRGPIDAPNSMDEKLKAKEVEFLGLSNAGRLVAAILSFHSELMRSPIPRFML